MTELLIRDISDAVISQLKLKAQADGVSVEEEARRVLEASVRARPDVVTAQLEAVRTSIGQLTGISTTDILREDRDAH